MKPPARSTPAAPKLSVVIVAYDMQREIERTVRSLSPMMQRGIRGEDYEIIVVDNGSSEPLEEEPCRKFGAQMRWLRIEDASPSPAAALNLGIENARAELVGAMIDGARLASPGVLQHARRASRLGERAVIATLGFHLGQDVQPRSVAAGYDAKAEDALLEEAAWTEDGYRLFEISVPAASSRRGWFEAPAESNAVFMRSSLWQELGGFDESFTSAAGGLVNLDLFARACEAPGAQLVILLGEGTFHQVHGGAHTNSPTSRWEEGHAEYVRIRGKRFAMPDVEPLCLGAPTPRALAMFTGPRP